MLTRLRQLTAHIFLIEKQFKNFITKEDVVELKRKSTRQLEQRNHIELMADHLEHVSIRIYPDDGGEAVRGYPDNKSYGAQFPFRKYLNSGIDEDFKATIW